MSEKKLFYDPYYLAQLETEAILAQNAGDMLRTREFQIQCVGEFFQIAKNEAIVAVTAFNVFQKLLQEEVKSQDNEEMMFKWRKSAHRSLKRYHQFIVERSTLTYDPDIAVLYESTLYWSLLNEPIADAVPALQKRLLATMLGVSQHSLASAINTRNQALQELKTSPEMVEPEVEAVQMSLAYAYQQILEIANDASST